MSDSSTSMESPGIASRQKSPAFQQFRRPEDGATLAAAFGTLPGMVGVALLVRLATLTFAYQDHLNPSRSHWHFAWEMGMVAHSLVVGKGFASPYVAETGPTAWFSPVYPCLLAAIFKVFGVFSKTSAIVILSLNSVFSALTTIPIYRIARHTLSERVAKYAAWSWVFYPYAIWASATRIWENALSALLLATLIWLTLLLEESDSRMVWVLYGTLWALAALTNPAVLAVLPFLLLWVVIRRRNANRPWFTRTALWLAMLVVAITPWTMRNYRLFHRILPLRSNFWVEVRVGNTADTSDIYPDWAIPSTSAAELQRLRRLGEVAYVAQSRRQALQFIREFPAVFAMLTAKRFAYVWTGFWSLDPKYARGEPFQIPNAIFCSSLTLLMLGAFVLLRDGERQWIPFFLAVIGPFPAVYYITHPAMEYRHPMEPMLVILVASTVCTLVERCRSRETQFAIRRIPTCPMPPPLLPETE